MLLFTPSATTDVNLDSLHEIAQLLLSYILSHHLRLTQIRSSATLPVHYILPDFMLCFEHISYAVLS